MGLASAQAAGPTLTQRVEACLLARFQETDIPRTDYAVLLSTRYRHALQEGKGEPDPAVLSDILERCQDRASPPIQDLEAVDWKGVELVDAGSTASLLSALASAMKALGGAGKLVRLGTREVRTEDLLRGVKKLKDLVNSGLTGAKLARVLPRFFDLYRSPGAMRTGEVLFTSYASPVYEGAMTRGGKFQIPVYRNPARAGLDPKEHDRAAIYGGALAHHGLEIAYLAQRMDEFQMQTEGSGFVRLPDGSYLHLTYAARNGRTFKSLGKALVRDGIFKPWEIDNPAVRRYFRAHPTAERPYLEGNPSFIFFDARRIKALPKRAGLTPGRAAALDRTYFPRGCLLFAHTERPLYEDEKLVGREPWERFVLAQDVGGLIKGPGRIDLYQGEGEAAQLLADTMKEPGTLYVLLLRGVQLL
jgi:membrane-bound lytic murein transglycosylase A